MSNFNSVFLRQNPRTFLPENFISVGNENSKCLHRILDMKLSHLCVFGIVPAGRIFSLNFKLKKYIFFFQKKNIRPQTFYTWVQLNENYIWHCSLSEIVPFSDKTLLRRLFFFGNSDNDKRDPTAVHVDPNFCTFPPMGSGAKKMVVLVVSVTKKCWITSVLWKCFSHREYTHRIVGDLLSPSI